MKLLSTYGYLQLINLGEIKGIKITLNEVI